MQNLLVILETHTVKIDMKCNENKTVCMVFKPKRRSQIVPMSFPPLTLGNFCVKYVVTFRSQYFRTRKTMMIYSEKCAVSLCEQTYLYAVLVNVLMQLNLFCLGHIVSACTMLVCGLTTIGLLGA